MSGPPTRKVVAGATLSLIFGGIPLGTQASSAHSGPERAPTIPAQENLATCRHIEITAQIEYFHERTQKKIQCFDLWVGDPPIKRSALIPPVGFLISPEWDGVIDVNRYVPGFYATWVPVIPKTYPVTVSYVFFDEEIGTQTFPSVEHGSVLDESRLQPPEGYQLAVPFSPQTVTGALTLTVELVRSQFDVTLQYSDRGAPVDTQSFTGFELGSTIAEPDLIIPEDYVLDAPFPDYAVTGHAELDVPVTPKRNAPGEEDADQHEDGNEPGDPDGAADATGGTDGDDTDVDNGSDVDGGAPATEQPKLPTPPHTPAGQSPALAATGGVGTAALLFSGAALTALGAAALITHRLRKRRE